MRLEDLIAKSRWGEADRLAQRLQKSSPQLLVHGDRLDVVAGLIADRVRELEATVRVPPAPSAEAESHLIYARQLAMLGREEPAIEHLGATRLATAEALNLLGTIYESRSDWSTAEAHFGRALAAHETAKSPGLAQAQSLTGLGYARRKQGRYPAAEEAYLRLWEVLPTAETAFLLAQFYEDTQQPTAAGTFARRAMDLDPVRYSGAGRKLLEALRTRHFGCFRVPK